MQLLEHHIWIITDQQITGSNILRNTEIQNCPGSTQSHLVPSIKHLKHNKSSNLKSRHQMLDFLLKQRQIQVVEVFDSCHVNVWAETEHVTNIFFMCRIKMLLISLLWALRGTRASGWDPLLNTEHVVDRLRSVQVSLCYCDVSAEGEELISIRSWFCWWRCCVYLIWWGGGCRYRGGVNWPQRTASEQLYKTAALTDARCSLKWEAIKTEGGRRDADMN